jgi:hypothetical protein
MSALNASSLRLALPILRRRRALIVCFVVGLLAVACLSYSPWRHQLLRAAGWALVAADPTEPADLIVIAVDADGEGVLEAADLVKAGIADRVALFSDPPDEVDREFRRRGLAYHNAAAISQQQLRGLGITQVEVIPRSVAGTEDEATLLPQWCIRQRLHTIVFIGSADHTRRTQRQLARTTRGLGLKVIVRPSRYSGFNPDTWWQSRRGVRTEIVEAEKLLLDILRHPLQ